MLITVDGTFTKTQACDKHSQLLSLGKMSVQLTIKKIDNMLLKTVSKYVYGDLSFKF